MDETLSVSKIWLVVTETWMVIGLDSGLHRVCCPDSCIESEMARLGLDWLDFIVCGHWSYNERCREGSVVPPFSTIRVTV